MANLAAASSAFAGAKPVNLRFYGHMCADEPYSVSLEVVTEAGIETVTVNGAGHDCYYYANTDWGSAKLVPDQTYKISTDGNICSTHIPFDKKCFRLFVRAIDPLPEDPYQDWTETDEIDKYQSVTDGVPNKDAGGKWEIVLTDKDYPSFGSGSAQLGSVLVGVSLGGLPSGVPPGKLILETDTIGPISFTPAALRALVLSADVEVLKSGVDLRQIYTWDGLVDIVVITAGFEVRFYSLADVGAKGSDGYYAINAGAIALVTWSFVNPDQNATNRLAVKELRAGVPVLFNTYTQTTSLWTLETGIGTQVRTRASKALSTVAGRPVEVVTDTRYSSPAAFVTTTRRTYRTQAGPPLADKLQSVEYPDGRKDTFAYESGTYDTTTRTFTAGPGTFLRTTSTHGQVAVSGLLAGKSTQEVLVADAQGHTRLETLYAYTGAAFAQVTQTWHAYDTSGHLTSSTRDGQPVYSATWNFNTKTSETDETGIETTILYDSDSYFNRTKVGIAAGNGYPAQPNISSYGYRGDYSTETTTSTGLTTYSESLRSNGKSVYAIQNELRTDYTYVPTASGGIITTITRPGGATEIREEDAERRLLSVTGTAVPEQHHTYGTDVDGNQWEKVTYGSATSLNYVKTISDWLGRAIREERPAYTGLSLRQFFYNAQGLRSKETTTGLADRLYEFDAMGNEVRTGLDMDGNGRLDLASTDRIEDTVVTYQQAGSNWYRVTTRTNYLTDNAATATSAYDMERLNLPLDTLSEVRSVDVGGNETVRTVTVDRAAKLVTETVQVPGSSIPAVTITRNGLLQSTSTNTVAEPTTFTSDALGRQTSVTDPLTGTQTSIFYDDGQYASDRVAYMAKGDQWVNNIYYSAQEASPGLLKARSVSGDGTYFAYDSRGQTVRTWGGRAYPTWSEYDALGRLWKLHTYRDGADWSEEVWPSGAGAGDVTTWNYQATTGLLISKTDAAGKSVNFTYKPFGQVEARTWHRGVSTTYSYNSAGEVTGIDYSDATPDVAIGYRRSGGRKNMTDAAGSHTMTYSPAGQLRTDAIGGSGILAKVAVAVGYDGLFRKTTLEASIGGTPLLPQQTFDYDPTTGRVQSAGDGSINAVYAYKPQSDWLHTTTFQRDTTTVMTATREPDSLNRLHSVTNSVSDQTVSSSAFTWRYDGRGLRDRLTLADDSYWSYGYDDRAQLQTGAKYWPNSNSVVGMQHAYNFDAIGNRTTTITNGRTATYAPTALNQYASRTVPGAFDVLGEAAAGATVTINNLPADRWNTFFTKTLPADNTTGAVFPSVNIVGVKNNAGPAGKDVVTTLMGNVFVPQTPEKFGYDDDGNLTSDGRWTYAWDAENRLISMTSHSDAPAASKMKLRFDYDASGRRIRKTVEKWFAATNSYLQTEQLRFVYDGWNLIAEINATNTPLRTYLWGLDLSGTFDGAGGIGGLLAITDHKVAGESHYLPGYDGNGNITSLVDSENGSTVASYIYGPFGELISKTGGYASINPLRFSSKYVDVESETVYYGFRYYCPNTGRWLSRDPIGESDSSNLYSFVGNNGINFTDPLGLRGNPPTPVEFLLEIPDIARAKGWPELASLFDYWFSRPAHTITEKVIVKPGDPYNDTIIGMDWVLSFPRAKNQYESLLTANSFFSSDAKSRLKRKVLPHVEEDGSFGSAWMPDSVIPTERHQHWIAQASVGSRGLFPDRLDAALHSFTLQSVIGGCMYQSGLVNVAMIKEIAVYVKDSFDFTGDQNLGYWAKPATVLYPNNYGFNGGGYQVSNETFRRYRAMKGSGGDFFVFSKVKTTKLEKPIFVPLE